MHPSLACGEGITVVAHRLRSAKREMPSAGATFETARYPIMSLSAALLAKQDPAQLFTSD